MTTDRQDLLAALSRLQLRCEKAEQALLAEHGEQIEAYRHEVSAGVDEALRRFRHRVSELSGDNELCLDLVDQTCDYVEWLQWVFWDLPYFAVPMGTEPGRFRHAVASCGLVYLSARLLDDLMDRHFYYRGRRSTLLATFSDSHGEGRRSERITMLAALLLCFEGLQRLSEGLTGEADQPLESATAARMILQVVTASSAAVVGAIMEQSPAESWSEEYYERLIGLKNVAYWRCLYSAIDPGFESPLYPFLADYYTVAQKLNDIQDFPEDESRGQPNLISILRARSPDTSTGRSGGDASEPTVATIERVMAEDFLRLGRAASELPAIEGQVAGLKLGEYLKEAHRLGLFSPPTSLVPEEEEARRETLDLLWDSRLDEFLDKLGPDALETVDCPVCGHSERRLLLRKHGFSLQRCADCSHVFVSPRLCEEIPTRLAEELDGSDEDPFLRIQNIFAGYLCQTLTQWAVGPRLLDIGFGHGVLLRMARAYGFEVYGIEVSRVLSERLRPFLGVRLEHARVADAELPWGSFDVVVMSHVVEHFSNPRPVLARVRDAVRRDGLLYVAVPDLDSLHFRVFGKRWEAINPVVHTQYFNETSLTRLLESTGFEVLSRIEHPAFRPQRAPRWMRLFCELGGNESGELALLARAMEE